MSYKKLSFLCSLAILMMASCSSSEPDISADSDPVEVKFSLSARAGLTSRADGVAADPFSNLEMIQDWWLVFVDRTDKVHKIIKRSDAETDLSVPSSDAFEQETFKCVLPAGNYKVFAFANISAGDLTAAAGLTFTEGEKVDLSAVQTAVWRGLNDSDGLGEPTGAVGVITADIPTAKVSHCTNDNLNLWDASQKPLPMTGYRTITVTNRVEETFSIEVVRMTAKIEFQFSNPTDETVTVTSVGIDPVTVTPVSLFPTGSGDISYDHLGESAFTPLADAGYGLLTLPLDLQLPTGSKGVSTSFYCKESISDRLNDDAFTVRLGLRHGDGISEQVQYNLTRDIRSYINRNDWVVIPIVLSQYLVEVEALFYPPIGGYPAMVAGLDPDGSRVFTFGTEGDFEIAATVLDKLTDAILPPSRYRVSGLTVSGDNIFTKAPELIEGTNGLPAEIIGTLSSGVGRAIVTVKVDIYDDDFTPGANPAATYSRTIYLIRKN